MDVFRWASRSQLQRAVVLAGLTIASVGACSSERGLGVPADRTGATPVTSADAAPPGSAGPWSVPQSASAADARTCQATSRFAEAGSGAAGRAGSVLLVSGTAGPEAGDVPVKERMEDLGYLVQVRDDDVVSVSDAAGMDLVMISESVSSSAIGSTFTPLEVPIVVWERHLFEPLKMSVGNNWHTDPQDRIYVSDATLLCGVSGEVTVATSAEHPMNRTVPPDSATIWGRRSASSDEVVWFGYGTGDLLTDGTPAPAPRIALWFSYDSPLHTNALGWELFARTIEIAVGAAGAGPSGNGLDQGGDAAAPSTSNGPVTRSGPPIPTAPATTPPTDPTATSPATTAPESSVTSSTAPSTTSPSTTPPADPGTTSPTTAPSNTSPTTPTSPLPTTAPPTTAPTTPSTTTPPTEPPTPTEPPPTTPPPTEPAPTTTDSPTTSEPPEEEERPRPPGGGPPPWAGGAGQDPEPDDDG